MKMNVNSELGDPWLVARAFIQSDKCINVDSLMTQPTDDQQRFLISRIQQLDVIRTRYTKCSSGSEASLLMQMFANNPTAWQS